MALIFVASPYRGETEVDTALNVQLAREACRFVLNLGKTPVAAHLLYPRFLDDKSDDDREKGIQCGLDILNRCDELWFFTRDGQLTEGMRTEGELAKQNEIPIRMLVYKEGGFVTAL